uniref:Uncharacterized protein n=1 Tax=Piliocolobus tephrosceles TaxID=591936 RepID=A0A8C9GNH1_9PRIM
MLKEEQEVAVLGASHNPAPLMSTVIYIRCETSVSNHVIWSLFSTLFMNSCCLGFIALASSVKSRDWKMVGDLTRAPACASIAKCLNIGALMVGILVTILLIVIPVLIFQVSRKIRRHHPGQKLCPRPVSHVLHLPFLPLPPEPSPVSALYPHMLFYNGIQ